MLDSALERAQQMGHLKRGGSKNITLAPCSFVTLKEAEIRLHWIDRLRQKICLRVL